ncbi:MAG: proline--tRNA ligase [Bacilli bacterium]|nr:proline--tRNA ligase [Bacilli bacterium]
MRMSSDFFITRKEVPKDENTISSKLLLKSGMIFKNDNGIYTYLPMGLKLLENIKRIIRNEMIKSCSAEEILMPSLVSANIFEDSERDSAFNSEIFSIKGRDNKKYSLCATHEELFTMLVKNKIDSYKDLHFTLFQISNKFRDEVKTKYGLVRKKEFYMADAYSFDADEGGLDISYDKMYLAFNNIFNRMGINAIVCNSDPMSMNGTSSEEFQVVCDYGDNEIVKCDSCSYCTNIEYATSYDKYKREENKLFEKSIVKVKSIDELNIDKSSILKSVIIKVNDNYKMILLKGDSEINVYKLYKLFKTTNIEFPDDYELEKIGTCLGFIGPISSTMEIIADNEVKSMSNAVCGANKKGFYYINVNPGIDFKISKYSDIKLFDENSLCPRCKSKAKILHGVEVGQIFKLDTNYSKKYDLKYTDETNEEQYVYMGSYGIGLDRCIDAIVETHHDEKGIIWPMSVAPYKVAIIIINVNDREAYKYGKKLYEKLNGLNIDTILDDRHDTVGVKFNDMDLIGVPIRITIGQKFQSGFVEFKLRTEENSTDVELNSILNKILNEIENYVV